MIQTTEEKIKEIDESLIERIQEINKEIESREKMREALSRALGVRVCDNCGTKNLHYSKTGWCCAFC